jgi:hypothetical protein
VPEGWNSMQRPAASRAAGKPHLKLVCPLSPERRPMNMHFL